MKYYARRTKKLFKKITRTDEGDGYRDPLRTADKMFAKRLTKMSRGGKAERSVNKRVGNVLHRNIDKHLFVNSAVMKLMKRIDNLYMRRK